MKMRTVMLTLFLASPALAGDEDYKFMGGTGKHTGKHGGAILPDSLRWLWSVPEPKAAPK